MVERYPEEVGVRCSIHRLGTNKKWIFIENPVILEKRNLREDGARSLMVKSCFVEAVKRVRSPSGAQ